MKQAALEQLLHCRRTREQMAGDALVQRLAASGRAHDLATRARDAVVRYEAERVTREASLFAELRGRKVGLAELERYKTRVAELAAESERKRSEAVAAEAEANRSDGLVTEARALLHRHRRDHEKWRELTMVSAQAAARVRDLVAELEDESALADRAGAARASSTTV